MKIETLLDAYADAYMLSWDDIISEKKRTKSERQADKFRERIIKMFRELEEQIEFDNEWGGL